MAQTVTPPTEAPRPLPRRPASSQSPRPVRPPRLVPLDAVWMVTLILLVFAVSALLPHPTHVWWPGLTCAAGTVVLLYLLGWRARDRAAGIVAGLLAATSVPFLHRALIVPLDATFVLLVIASLFSFVAGSSLIALAFAGLAAVDRPDGLVLGLMLLGLALAQRRRRAGLGALAFVLLAGGGWAARISLGHAHFPMVIIGTQPWLATWAITGGMIFISWLLLPFLAELGEAPRRARWLPVALWTLVYGAVETSLRVGGRDSTVFGLMPLWFALAGGGLSRLLPALTGDVPLPWVRYGLATLAVLSLLAMRGRAEWPVTHPAPQVRAIVVTTQLVPPPVSPKFVQPVQASRPAPKATPPPAAAMPTHTPAALPRPTVKAAPKPVAKAAPKPVAKAAPKPVAKAAPKPVAKAAPKPVAKAAPKPVAKAAPKTAVVHPVYRPRVFYRYYRPLYRRRFVRRYRR